MPAKRKTGKKRLDVLLVERGLADSRQKAQAMLLAGKVLVGRQPQAKAGTLVAADSRVELAGEPQRYVGRGGLKLEGALADFAVPAQGKLCLDVGSSTGGFTDCLLQHGAARVYAVDVSPEQLDWRLRNDARVVTVKQNARNLSKKDCPEAPELVTIDVSFISVTKILHAVAPLARPGAELLILTKPQFELDRGEIGRGGIVRDEKLHQKAIERVTAAAAAAGLLILGVRRSRIAGAEGNQEFFLHARKR